MGNYKGSENFYCSRYGDPRNAKLWNLLEDKLLISSHTRPQTHYFKFFQTVTRSSAGKKEILGGLKLIILKMSKNMIRGAKIFLKNLTLPRLGGGQNDPRLSKSPLNTRKWKNSKMKIQKNALPKPRHPTNTQGFVVYTHMGFTFTNLIECSRSPKMDSFVILRIYDEKTL